MGVTAAGVTVVVPTVDRPELLARCLSALAAQTRPADEVVVVHDGRADLAGWAGRLPLTVLHAGRSASAKRNAGWRVASHELVAFTDDDCAPSPGWLAALVAADGDVLHGPVAPHPDDAHVDSVFARTLSVAAADDHFPAANLAVRRSLLAAVGGFDETLSGGEDTDLAWRAVEAGGRRTWVAAALVQHAVRPATFPQHLASLWRWRSLPEVVRRHPELREGLPFRVFWKGSHPVALLALGAAIAPWRPRAALMAAPLLAVHWRARGPRFGTQTAVADVAEVVVVLVGSVRSRSVLL